MEDPCDPDPCVAGTCSSPSYDEYICTCDNEYQQGSTCNECVDGYENHPDCDTAIDYCATSPCVYGTCTYDTTGYTCTCTSGYSGVNCDSEINECLSNPCNNGGTCSDQLDGFTCTCTTSYSGTTCDTFVDACDSSPCLNGATCNSNTDNTFSCSCAAGYEGTTCDSSCDTNPCCYVSQARRCWSRTGGGCFYGIVLNLPF